MKDIEYQVDTYIGCEHYCHALPQAETDWSKEILIYNDIVDQLVKELHKIPPQTIYIGYHTGPYQPCEAEYRQTRKVLELFFKNGFSANILTKSDLVVRDIEILKEMNDAAISVSVAFNDNQTRRLFEANTIDTEKRIEALNKYKDQILNYFKHPITNTMVEGINNKNKTLKRQAYGFRDIEYFKLRLYHLHRSKYSFAG